MKKSLIIIVVLVLIVLGIVYWMTMRRSDSPYPSDSIQPPQTPTSNLNQELETINLGSIESEFKAIDDDLKALQSLPF